MQMAALSQRGMCVGEFLDCFSCRSRKRGQLRNVNKHTKTRQTCRHIPAVRHGISRIPQRSWSNPSSFVEFPIVYDDDVITTTVVDTDYSHGSYRQPRQQRNDWSAASKCARGLACSASLGDPGSVQQATWRPRYGCQSAAAATHLAASVTARGGWSGLSPFSLSRSHSCL